MLNLASQDIVELDGTPGSHYRRAVQSTARDDDTRYSLHPQRTGPFAKLPQPSLNGAFNPATLQPYGSFPDPRFAALTANGPFQITKFVNYSDGLGDAPPASPISRRVSSPQ